MLKRFGRDSDDMAKLRREAELGKRYLKELRREVVRLAMLADDGLDGGMFAKAAQRLEESELRELESGPIPGPGGEPVPGGAAAAGAEPSGWGGRDGIPRLTRPFREGPEDCGERKNKEDAHERSL